MLRLNWAFAALALAGCDSGPDDAAVLAAADKLAEPLPGLYRSTTTFETYELPDADAREAQVAQDRMAGLAPQVREFCLTPEEASGGFRKMLAAMQDGDCTFEKFSAEDGSLDARMRCRSGNGIVSTIGMAGDADPQSSKIALDIEQVGNSVPGGTARMRMTVASVRTGDCPGPADSAVGEGTTAG